MTLIGEGAAKTMSRKHRNAIYLLTAWVAVMTTRVIAGSWNSKFPIEFPDSFSYIKVADFGPLSLNFWFGERPLLTPLLLWVVGGGVREFVLAQTLLYFVAAATLCYVALRIFSSNISRIISTICVLSIVAQSRYALWNSHLLSESLGMSTSLISIAAWLWYSHERSKRSITLAWIASAAWMLARDSNTAVTIIIVVSLAASLFILRNRKEQNSSKKFRLGIVALILIGSFAYIGQNVSGRNDNPVMNNIGQRVLPNSQLLEWYEGRGMPVSDFLIERTGKNAFDDEWKMLTEPELESFREWARDSGQFWQLVSFIRFAPHWISQSVNDIDGKLAYDYHDYDKFEIAEKLPDGTWLGTGGPQSAYALLVWLILAVLSLAMIWQSNNRVRATILTVLLLSCFVDYFISWVGDSVEVNRHLVGPVFRTSIILALILASGANTYLTEIRRAARHNVTE
jgi:hypothetical protein